MKKKKKKKSGVSLPPQKSIICTTLLNIWGGVLGFGMLLFRVFCVVLSPTITVGLLSVLGIKLCSKCLVHLVILQVTQVRATFLPRKSVAFLVFPGIYSSQNSVPSATCLPTPGKNKKFCIFVLCLHCAISGGVIAQD